MSDTKLKMTIGAFVLSGIVLLIASILIIGGGFSNNDTPKIALFFNSSLKGLVPGAPVYFKGIRIGKVNDIQVFYDSKDNVFKTPVIVEIDTRKDTSQKIKTQFFADKDMFAREQVLKRMIKEGLRAELGISSFLTGQLCVEFDFFPSAPPADPANYPSYQGYSQVPTQLSTIDSVLASLEDVPIEELIMNISGILKHLNNEVTRIDFTKIADTLQSVLENTNEDIQKFDKVADDMRVFLDTYTKIGKGLDQNLPKTFDNANNTLVSTRQFIKNTDKVIPDVKRLVQSITQTSDTTQRFLSGKTLPMIELTTTLQAIKKAAQAIAELSVNLEIRPNSLIFGRKAK